MTDAPATPETTCGFVAVLGAPNAGKSTLVNRLVGAKVSIVSPKVQTTRTRVTGIGIEGKAQIVFIDTPGIFRGPRRRLDRAMIDAAWRGARDADMVLLVVDASRARIDDDTQRIVAELKDTGRKAVLALNKIDLVRKETLLDKANALSQSGIVSDIFMISATEGDGVDDLKRHLAGRMPPGPWHYPEDQLSDMPQRLLAAEITREQIYLRLHDELPYAVHVTTEAWEERRDGSARIDQVILVEREGQKPIVIGKQGATLKAIGAAARKQIEEVLGRKAHLFLTVKVQSSWAEQRGVYDELGIDWKS